MKPQQRVQQLRQQQAAAPEPLAQLAGQLIKRLPRLAALDQPDAVLDKMVALIAEQFQVNHAAILLHIKGELVAQAAHTEREGAELALSHSILQAVLESGQPFFSPNAIEDERLAGAESVAALDIRAVAAVPLIARGGIMGVLYVASYGQPSQLTEAGLPYLQATANQAAQSLENAWLYAEDRQLISWRQQVQDRAASEPVVLSTEQLLAHQLGAYLERKRREAGLTIHEVAARSKGIITKGWLSRAERGDVGRLQNQLTRLLTLAELYDIPPEVPMALAGLEVSLPEEPASEWLREMLQEPVALAALHQVWQLEPAAREQAWSFLASVCDWLAETTPPADKTREETG